MSASNPRNDALEPIANLNRLIHEPARLMIMAFLYVVDSADFIFTLNQTGLTRGNLSTHMTKLEEAGYLEVKKEFVEKRPLTMLQLTDKGREAFQAYRDSIQEVMGSLTK